MSKAKISPPFPMWMPPSPNNKLLEWS
jgi:hypothetical protein